MDEESKDLVKAAAEGASAGAVGQLLEKLLGPAVELTDLIRDHVRFRRGKAQMKMLEKTLTILEERNISPNAVAWKVLFPLLDYASLEDEDDESMIDRWAALLANAASGTNRGATVLPSFPRILSELSPEEAAILDMLYRDVNAYDVPTLHQINDVRHSGLGEGDPMFVQRCFNLDRLGLVEASWENVQVSEDPMRFERTVYRLEGNALGLSFVLACTPPRCRYDRRLGKSRVTDATD